MNCACTADEGGKVVSACGAHHNWLREVEESRKPKVTHLEQRASALNARFQEEIAKQALEIRDLRASYDEQMKTGLELESQRDAALLQVDGMKKIVEAARTLVEAEKQRGETPFQMDCLLADLRKTVEDCGGAPAQLARDVTVSKVEFPDKEGGLSLTAKAPAFAVLAQECVKLFKGDGAVNYCEWRLNSGDPSFGTFTVTIQRENGKTMAQVNAGLRAELKASQTRVLSMREIIRWFATPLEIRKEKLGRTWSFGFWEGADPGLALVNGGEQGIENSRFNAVLRLTSEELNAILAAASEKTTGEHGNECTCGWKPHLLDCPTRRQNLEDRGT